MRTSNWNNDLSIRLVQKGHTKCTNLPDTPASQSITFMIQVQIIDVERVLTDEFVLTTNVTNSCDLF